MIWKKLISPWIPEKKYDEISGKLIRVYEKVGKNESMLYVLETEEFVRGVWGSTVLDEMLKIFEVGDYIKIIFLGKKEGKRKEGYKAFESYRGSSK